MPLTPAAVHALEERRTSAVLEGDVAVLRELMSPECRYVHATGRLDTGTSYLDNLAQGGFGYLRLEVADREVSVHGTTAVAVYRQRARIRIGADEVVSVARCTAVWADTGAAVRLVAFQSTPLPEPPPESPTA